MSDAKIATYEEVKDLPNHPEKVLVDVRDSEELEEHGKIPTSIHIPLSVVEKELQLSPEEFKSKYGREKPSPNTEIIFHCMKGGRAQKAADAATALGFLNTRNYKGSFTDWMEREGTNL